MRGASSEIPKGYEKIFMTVEGDATFETFYNPNEKDCAKAYIKKEVKA